MNIRKIPTLVLATALQVLPICRVACVNQAIAPTGFAIVTPWVAGAVALLGSYHAVSGASASISGIALWTRVTNGTLAGPVCPPASATGTVGQPLVYKIILANPGTMNQQMDYYNYDTLPPGLTINTNVGGADGQGTGFITGTPSQTGVYTVTLLAGNLNWPQTVTKAIPITVSGGGGATAPAITGPPVNQTVTAGTNVSFNVAATGTAPLIYSWKFNTIAIAGATTSSLQLTNVQTTNSGNYSVTVANSAGSASASATLTVNAAATGPSITAQPQSLTVSNGAAASFSVTASGTAPLSYQWVKGASTLTGATNSTYSIASVTTNDAGSYSVVVTNSAGSIGSSSATLTVLLPPSILTPPQNQTVQAGTNVSFTVAAAGSTPLSYKWSFNGSAIIGAATNSLQLTNVQTTNTGTYLVTVSNSVGSASASATLTVNSSATKPSVVTQPQSLTVSNGAAASFSVTAGGTTPLSYQWLKGTSTVSAATNSAYSIAAVTTNDAASYSVVITNSAGSITSSVATLTVLYPPAIVTPPQSLTVSNGVNANFTVVAGGSPPLTYLWRFSGGALASATSSSLTITNVQPGNQGDYTVVVSNAVGVVASPAAHLTLQGAIASSLHLGNLQPASGFWSFDVTGPAQTNYVIWTSTDLSKWATLKTNFSASGTVHFTDSNAPAPAKFYRATLSP